MSPVPGRVDGRVDGFSGLSIPRKSPRSPADGRPLPPPRLGRLPLPMFGRLPLPMFGRLPLPMFGRLPLPMLGRLPVDGSEMLGRLPDDPPRPGMLGRVEGRVLGRLLLGRDGVEGRVEGFSPPDGREGGRLMDGRLVEGRLIDGRVVGRLGDGRLTLGRRLPMLGTLGRDIERPPPTRPPPARPPPPRSPPPRRPPAMASAGHKTAAADSSDTMAICFAESCLMLM